MKKQVLQNVSKHIEDSTVIKASKAVAKAGGKSVLFGADAEPLSPAIIAALEANGCWSDDWSKVKAVAGFDPVRVRRVGFIGDVTLGKFTGTAEIEPGVVIPTGVYEAVLVNSEVGDDAVVDQVKLLSSYVVKEGSVLFNCGTVAVTGETVFGNGTELPIAIETGGRETRIFGEMSCVDAEWVGRSRDDKKFLADYNKLVDDYVKAVTSKVGTIGPKAIVRNTPKIVDAFVGECAIIDGATLISNATLISAPKREETGPDGKKVVIDERARVLSGAFVRDSILQWGCEVSSMAIVDQSLLTEHSHVERHGKVTQSILGPNTGVAEGEVTACLCGPFVGFHHQALLIACFWPEGKGNVGYGANVGSNHTSKAPDQELWAGEGTFFGLGVNIKFPSDFTRAPYSIIASGVNALPQKVMFPFSLINSPAERMDGISPAYNEIMPAWVLSDNIYTLRRNEKKYKDRNKARRTEFVFDVFRPDTADLMIDARARLSGVKGKRYVYTDRDIKGLGKNYMTEDTRTEAIKAYTFYIRYYALEGLKTYVDEQPASKLKNVLTTKTGVPRWEHERAILSAEFGETASPATLLNELDAALRKIAEGTEESKKKDDDRGPRIIDDYASAHAPAAEDKFVKETWKSIGEEQAEIKELIKKLG